MTGPASQAVGPQHPSTLPPFPHGATTRRLDWLLLPPTLRRLVESRFGTQVAHAESAGSGYTPGCASVLTGADGRRMFLKAASKKAQKPFAAAYVAEARTLRSLPTGLPVPRLLWTHEDDLWVVLAFEYVEHANPARPWRPDELERCLDTLEVLAQTLTPPPMTAGTFADGFADCPESWEHVRRVAPQWPHLEEAAALAAGFAVATAGSTLVHTDVRDDNLMLPAHGRPMLCDWNFATEGAPWIDTVCLLLGAAGDGLDVEEALARRPLTRNVAPEHVDSLLAMLAGYFLERRDAPVPNSSPYLRRHQSWYAEASWAWLAQRRGWA
ncbi:MAG: aminoglycoside phosphotransferase family protein [Nocardioidaceae bacterium]|nr:aminoglycoside phosphotransferase family protein [Nocardioidaceae bacterium]NUS50786.1 aminoglycoside phosphotransferase family protein [Nocardioidaceae bacterium]